MSQFPTPDGVTVTGTLGERYDEILSLEALEFLADLQRRFGARRTRLLALREDRQAALHAGATLEFLSETEDVRTAEWTVRPPAAGLVDRRVEITGPTDRKMAINALNSGAKVWLADFEDANAPTWANMVEGQLNLRDAIDGTLDLRLARRQGLRARRRAGDDRGASTRLAPG